MRSARIAAVVLACAASATAQDAEPAAPIRIGGVLYEKRETRAATREHMTEVLQPRKLDWGDWYLLTPFPYAGHNQYDLATVHPPEAELARMRAGGPGPDLEARYTGKQGLEVTWRPLGDI